MRTIIELQLSSYLNGNFEGYVYKRNIKYTGRWKIVRVEEHIPELFLEIILEKDVSKWYQCERMEEYADWVHEDDFHEKLEYEKVEYINECLKLENM